MVSLLLNINENKSPGGDCVPNVFLRRYAELLSQYFYILFCESIKQGCLPKDCFRPEVVPMHKYKDKVWSSNYRLISLTSTCCKILEPIVASRIATFLQTNSVLVCFQDGIRKDIYNNDSVNIPAT